MITPSLPTFSMALAINSPISRSPLADIVPTYRYTHSIICNESHLHQKTNGCQLLLHKIVKNKGYNTCAISSDVLIIRALLFKFVTTASTAIVMPRLKSIAFIPAATDLHPSVNIARVRIVAHVVPETQGNWHKQASNMMRKDKF